MKRETLQKAFDQISDRHIAEAAQPAKRRLPRWVAPVAAALAVVILAGAIAGPMLFPKNTPIPGTNAPTLSEAAYLQYLAAAPVYPEMAPYPEENNYNQLAFDNWQKSQSKQYDQPAGYADSADVFFTQITEALLSGAADRNVACSPVNVYMALAMLAEVTEGESRQQILDALGADSIEALRTQAGHVWNAHYCADNATTLTLANSLWLDRNLAYNDPTVRTLADSYYTSVLQGQLGSEEVNAALRSWINQQTGGLLEQQAAGIELPPETLLALASTVYYRCHWAGGYSFIPKNNTEGIFYGPQSEKTVTYMNQYLDHGPYYYGDNFGAAFLRLADGSRMWLILPDEGSAPTALLEAGILQTILHDQAECMQIKVNLSLPKFDISANFQLEDAMRSVGIADVFSTAANFSGILQQDTDSDSLGVATHAARVTIDEEGIEAAAYTILADAGSAPPMDTAEIHLVLDRPFLFLIESRDGLPLFAGIVNEP